MIVAFITLLIVGFFALSFASLLSHGATIALKDETDKINEERWRADQERKKLPKSNIYKTDMYEQEAFLQYAREYPEECAILTADRGDGIRITSVEKVWKSENYQRILKEVKRGW